MSRKKYRIQTSCPQCGCSAVSNLTEEEIKERYGDVSNVTLACDVCMEKYEADLRKECKEWDMRCKMEEKFPELHDHDNQSEHD